MKQRQGIGTAKVLIGTAKVLIGTAKVLIGTQLFALPEETETCSTKW